MLSLGADFNGLVAPTQFLFSGALIPLTNPNSYSFDIQTSDTGAIIDWTISIKENVGISVNWHLNQQHGRFK